MGGVKSREEEEESGVGVGGGIEQKEEVYSFETSRDMGAHCEFRNLAPSKNYSAVTKDPAYTCILAWT